jgi:phosphatidylinositol alpha-1,6-mannosyltransferase
LTLVTAGLELDGGGRALVGRLLARAASSWAAERGLDFDVLSLRGADLAELDGTPRRSFHGRPALLALHLARRRMRDPDRLHLYDLLGLARAEAWMPPRLRSRFALMLNGIEVWKPLAADRRRALAAARVRLAISAHTLREARAFVPDLEAEVLHLALEERSPQGEVADSVLASAGEAFLLMVGRMAAAERYKGHDQVLEALARLTGRRPDARLVVAGDGEDRARLEAKAAALGLADRACFTGFVSEATLQALYARSAGLVLPSRGEGFGLVYLEAMRAGKPCVAARASAAAEIVVDGETGFLVDPEDRAGLEAALERLLSDPALADRLGSAGRERWRREFGYPRFRARLAVHLDRLRDADVRH